jgi:hypothetical protein
MELASTEHAAGSWKTRLIKLTQHVGKRREIVCAGESFRISVLVLTIRLLIGNSGDVYKHVI